MRFSASELEIGRPLWIALSDLYLDTVPEWGRIAGYCARSPFSIAELQRILVDEVHPVVHANLWSVDGVYEDWLVASIVARRRRPLFRLPWPEDCRYPWRELKPLIIALRRHPERES